MIEHVEGIRSEDKKSLGESDGIGYVDRHRNLRLCGLEAANSASTLRSIVNGCYQALALSLGAQSPGQSAYFAKSSASERIDFSLSSDKPRSSSSLTRPSYKSLPNTCLSCEYR